MKYEQLGKDYKSDVIADAMYAREVEYFHYEFDSINYEFLLNNAPKGADVTDIQKRLADTRLQMAAVDNTYEALKAQITDEAEHEAAVIRTTKKRQEDALRTDK